MIRSASDPRRPRVAFGPQIPGVGSWEWIGADLAHALSGRLDVTFYRDRIPDCDVAVIIKFPPTEEQTSRLSRRCRTIYCPVDVYGSAADIDADWKSLRQCDLVLVHCRRLLQYFRGYARVESLDHHVKFVSPAVPASPPSGGPVLWTGIRANLPPLVRWVNRSPLPEELWVLTNTGSETVSAASLGFTRTRRVRVERWTRERHMEWASLARAAIDLKGDDFRARHKSAAKAIDFIASGLPLAMNADSSPAEHLGRLGLQVAAPTDTDYWFSREYWEATCELGHRLRRDLSLDNIAERLHSWILLVAGRESFDGRCSGRSDGRHWEPPDLEGSDRPYRSAENRLRSTAGSIAAAPERSEAASRSTATRERCAQAAEPWGITARTRGRSEWGTLLNVERTGTPPVTRRIAIVSLLFNWPSTGGGTVHTKELALFLSTAGYDVRQFYAVHDGWQVGQVREPLPYAAEPLRFAAGEWTEERIRERFRQAVTDYAPDYVIVTCSWNTKPLLAEALGDFPYYIRLAALECLCPLNNVRLLVDSDGRARQCSNDQLSRPQACRECVSAHGRLSGRLHRLERELAGFRDFSYADRLRAAFDGAEGVLVVNPAIAELVRPYARSVHVIPSGFDARRFPAEVKPRPVEVGQKKRILFAGLVNEFMKGFRVLQEAGAILWRQRQDFEVWATADPVGRVNEHTRYVGWQSQESLPGLISNCDLLVFPTIAQEALGRTAVEAMGCGRPVVASRIGGLPWVVEEGVTGLLSEPRNAADLADRCARLLDDADLRNRLGRAGREKFEREFTWDVVLRKYEDLFEPAHGPRLQEHGGGTVSGTNICAP